MVAAGGSQPRQHAAAANGLYEPGSTPGSAGTGGRRFGSPQLRSADERPWSNDAGASL